MASSSVSASEPGRSIFSAATGRSPGHAEAVQVGAVDVEPGLGAVRIRADAVDQPPEPRRVVHLDQMRHLMHGEIVQHERRREDQPPGVRQHAGGRARAPAARLVAHRDALDGDAELLGGAAARGFEIAQRLAAKEIADAAVDVRGVRRRRRAAPRRPRRSPVQTVPRTPGRCTMRCWTPRNGSTVPSAKGAASGRRRSRAAIQPPCFCANSLASRTLPRGGMVRMTSRVAAWMRSV